MLNFFQSTFVLLLSLSQEGKAFRLPNIKLPPPDSANQFEVQEVMLTNGTTTTTAQLAHPLGKYLKSAKPESEMFILGFGAITLLGMLLVLWKSLRAKQRRNARPSLYHYQQMEA